MSLFWRLSLGLFWWKNGHSAVSTAKLTLVTWSPYFESTHHLYSWYYSLFAHELTGQCQGCSGNETAGVFRMRHLTNLVIKISAQVTLRWAFTWCLLHHQAWTNGIDLEMSLSPFALYIVFSLFLSLVICLSASVSVFLYLVLCVSLCVPLSFPLIFSSVEIACLQVILFTSEYSQIFYFFPLREIYLLDVVVHTCEFEVLLGHIVSSRPAWTTWGDPIFLDVIALKISRWDQIRLRAVPE